MAAKQALSAYLSWDQISGKHNAVSERTKDTKTRNGARRSKRCGQIKCALLSSVKLTQVQSPLALDLALAGGECDGKGKRLRERKKQQKSSAICGFN